MDKLEEQHNDMILITVQLNNYEEARKVLENRYRSVVSQEEWGWGFKEDHRIAVELADDLADAQMREKYYTSLLEEYMAEHPLAKWMEGVKGINAKSLGRFIGALPNPLHTHQVGSWWRYSGLHVDGNGNGYKIKNASGQMDYNPKIKPRVRVMAENVLKGSDPYFRPFYDQVKNPEGTLHRVDCSGIDTIVPDVGVRRIYCKPPKGEKRQPNRAVAGEPMGKGHIHGQALRRVMKEIIKEAWRAERTFLNLEVY